MTRPEIPKYKTSRIVAGVIIAIAAAAFAPLLTGFCTTLISFTVINAFLYGFGGMVPAAAGMLLDVLAFGIYFGIKGALISVLAFVLPSVFIIRNLRWRAPFFKMLAQSIAAQVLGMLAALAAAYFFVGADLIGALIEAIRSLFDMVYPGAIDFVLSKVYDIEAVPDTLTQEQLVTGVLDEARRAAYLDGYLNEISASLRLTLPGYLLSASCLTGVLATAWPAKLINQRLPMNGAYVSLARWYTPWQISLGLLGGWVVTWLLTALGLEGGDSVQLAFQALLFLVLRVQAAASLQRRLIQFNMRAGLRAFIIVVAELIFGEFVIYYGAFSALFGSTGAANQLHARRADKDDK